MIDSTDAITSGGESLHPHALSLFAEIATAMVVHRVVIVGEPCDEAFLEHLGQARQPGARGQHERVTSGPFQRGFSAVCKVRGALRARVRDRCQ